MSPGVSIFNASTKRRITRKLNSILEDYQKASPDEHFVKALAETKELLNNTEVVAQVGGTATLSCHTGHISDEVVRYSTIFSELRRNKIRDQPTGLCYLQNNLIVETFFFVWGWLFVHLHLAGLLK